MHEVLPTVDPVTALTVGLKVDVKALPQAVIDAVRAGQGLTDPAVTVELLRLNAVVGVKGSVNEQGRLTTVGITCALCHSSVDNSLAPGIGRRLDGWANTDLNVGAIVALSPALDEATKAEFRTWGPGKYDPRHHAFDGMQIIPLNSPSLPIVIPPIYGLEGVGFETFTGDGPISYWNSYVGVGQMGGKGKFNDPRIGLFINQTPDLVTPKLAALLAYQLSLHPPKAPKGSFDREAAQRGERVFRGKARCSTCHRGPTFTDVLRGPNRRVPFLHDPAEVGMDPRYAERSATGQVPDDTFAWAVAAPAVLPRWKRCRPPCRGGALQQAVQTEPDDPPEGRSRRVPEVALNTLLKKVSPTREKGQPGFCFDTDGVFISLLILREIEAAAAMWDQTRDSSRPDFEFASAPSAGPDAQPGVPDARTVRVGVGLAPRGARHRALVTGVASAACG